MVLLSLEWTNLVPLRQVLWLKPRSGYRQILNQSMGMASGPTLGKYISKRTHTHTRTRSQSKANRSNPNAQCNRNQQHWVLLSIAEHRIDSHKQRKAKGKTRKSKKEREKEKERNDRIWTEKTRYTQSNHFMLWAEMIEIIAAIWLGN